MTVEMVKGIARGVVNEVVESVKSMEMTTTDATPAVLMTIPIQPYTNGRIKYIVSASNTDLTGALIIERAFRYTHDGTTLSIGTEADILVDNDLTATVAAAVGTDEVEIVITGVAATNLSWIGKYEQFNQKVEEVLP